MIAEMSLQIVKPYQLSVGVFPDSYLPFVFDWLHEFHAQMVDDYCPENFQALIEKNFRDGVNGGKSYAAIDSHGVPRGVVWGDFLGDGMYSGHLVFDRYKLTSYEKLAATREMLQQFYADGARKISWQVFADNRAFIIFLRRLGASMEGTLRKATRRNGELTDVVLMASFPEDKQ